MLDAKWPKRLVIVRHGQSEQNAALDLDRENLEIMLQQKKIRDADINLTKRGIWQAQETGKYLASTEPFDICFSSPYERTLQTSKNIIENIGYDLKIFKDFRIREKEFGMLHGFTADEIKKKYPEEFEARERDGKFYYRLPRGENYPDVGARVHSFLDKIHRDYAGKSVLVVTHQVPYTMFRSLFEHLDEEGVLSLPSAPNCGIEEFLLDRSKYEEGRLKLEKFNGVGYGKYSADL